VKDWNVHVTGMILRFLLYDLVLLSSNFA